MSWRFFLGVSFAVVTLGCGGGGTGSGSGGSGGTGGNATGGAGTGGTGTGGTAMGGGGTGGVSSTGGGAGGGTGGISSTGGAGGVGGGVGGAPEGFCRTQDDCAREGGFCYAPGTVPMCGTCFVPEYECGSDGECLDLGPTMICGIEGCFCSPGCIAGCTSNDDCEVGKACADDHHCSAKPCSPDEGCPVNFACSDNACGRKACSADTDCGGFCVLGQCWDALGVCAFPPP